MQPDFDTIKAFLAGTYRAGDVFEIRSLMQYGFRSQVGYFDNAVDAANAVVNNDNAGVAGFYHTINPVEPALIARVANRLVDAKAGSFTKDVEIPYRNSVFLDIDPIRPSGISSSEAEHQKALRKAFEVDWQLQKLYGFPPACIVDSGNGAHLRWATELLPNDEESLMLIRGFLAFTRKIFGTDGLDFDKGNFNASRIARLPGTIARKGENITLRPHRLSRVLRPGDAFAPVLSRRLLESLSRLPEKVNGHANGHAVSLHNDNEDKMYRKLNDAAVPKFHIWVPYLLGHLAYQSGDGYRISSDALGRPLEEAISISAKGVTDFGVRDMGDATEGRRTPVQLLAELCTNGDKRKAAEQLSQCINVPATEFDSLPLSPPGMPSDLMGGEPIVYDMQSLFSTNLVAAVYKPITWNVAGMIPAKQYVMLHAKPKVGKSTMARQLAIAVATGLPFMEHSVVQGEVVYIAYEEDEARWRDGIKAAYEWMARLEGIELTDADYERMFSRVHLIAIKAPREGDTSAPERQLFPRGEEGINAIRDYVDAHPNVRLVVLDPYESIFDGIATRDIKKQQRYEGDLIKSIYQNNNCSVIVVDHSKKEAARSDPVYIDVLDSTSGTAQKPAAADMIIALNMFKTLPADDPASGMKRGDKVGFMRLSGRYIQESEVKVQFLGPLGWIELPEDTLMPTMKDIWEQSTGRGAQPLDPMLEQKIVNVLVKEGKTNAQILADIINVSYARIRTALKKLLQRGAVQADTSFKTHQYFLPRNGTKLLDIL